MENNTTETSVVVPENTMSSNIESWGPSGNVSTGSGYWDGGMGLLSAQSISNLRHEVAQVGRLVKDSEAEVRSDVKDAECSINHNILKAESDIRRDVVKEASDTRDKVFDVLGAVKDAECRLSTTMLSQFGTVREQLIRNEYEAKLTGERVIKELSTVAQHNAERSQDKTDHGFEENEEKLDGLRSFIGEKFFHAREEDLEREVEESDRELQTTRLLKAICCGCGSDGPGNSGK